MVHFKIYWQFPLAHSSGLLHLHFISRIQWLVEYNILQQLLPANVSVSRQEFLLIINTGLEKT